MEDAGFSSAQFQEEAKFSRAHFMTEANFSRARFEGDAEFGRARIHEHLNLDSAKIYTMRLSDAAFEDGSSLNLTDLDFNRIVVRWETIKNHFPYNGSVYLALTKNFRNLEQFDDGDDCYYQYRREKQSRAASDVSKLLDRLAFISCGYGVRPSHTILLSFDNTPVHWHLLVRQCRKNRWFCPPGESNTRDILKGFILLQQHGVPGQISTTEFAHPWKLRIPNCNRGVDRMDTDGPIPGNIEQSDVKVKCTVHSNMKDDSLALSGDLWLWPKGIGTRKIYVRLHLD